MLLCTMPIAACAGDDDDSSSDASQSASAARLRVCDPLRAETQPVMLGKVIAVGRDSDAVLYVLTQPDQGDYQVFVSEDDVLQRHRTLGSGSGDEMWISVSVEGDPAFGLYVTLDANGKTASMQRFDPAGVTDKNKVPEGEDLEVLSKSAIDDLELRNLPAGVAIEYFGTIEDGRDVLVVRPTDDWGYEDFRVFLGTPKNMLEREVMTVSRSKSGPTFIDLTLDGKPATLDFQISYLGDHVEFGDSADERRQDAVDHARRRAGRNFARRPEVPLPGAGSPSLRCS